MKSFIRIAVPLAFTSAFLWFAYAAGRNWFLYATTFGVLGGHPGINPNLISIHRLETQWYFTMVVCAVLAGGCATLTVLRVLKLMKGGSTESQAEQTEAE
jgi:hypothetical protein